MSTRLERKLNTVNSIVQRYIKSKGNDITAIRELNSITPKSLTLQELGICHWVNNQKGKDTVLLHKGNYETYVGPNGEKLTEYEAMVCHASQVLKIGVQFARQTEEYKSKGLDSRITDTYLNSTIMTFKRMLNMVKDAHTKQTKVK